MQQGQQFQKLAELGYGERAFQLVAARACRREAGQGALSAAADRRPVIEL
jgi:hypothetical protein